MSVNIIRECELMLPGTSVMCPEIFAETLAETTTRRIIRRRMKSFFSAGNF